MKTTRSPKGPQVVWTVGLLLGCVIIPWWLVYLIVKSVVGLF